MQAAEDFEHAVTDEDLVRVAYDRVAWSYDDKFQRKLDQSEDLHVVNLLVRERLAGQVLDVGSGTGLMVELTGIHPDRYCGLDLSPVMVGVAHHKYPAHRFELGNMEDMRDIRDESFDSVVSLFGSFSHSTTPSATIAELWRVLRPGGKLLLMSYGRRYQQRRSYIMREKKVPTVFWTAGQLRGSLRERFPGAKVRGMSCLIDWLPNWLPQSVFNGLMRIETATVGRVAPTACYFLVATAIKPGGHRAA